MPVTLVIGKCVFHNTSYLYRIRIVRDGEIPRLLLWLIIMAKEDNLRNIDEYNKSISAEERTANARKAGEASGKARNLKARLLEWAEDGGYQKMLDMADEQIAEGNTKMWELVRDTIGEKPVDKTAQINVDAEYLESVEYVSKLFGEE